MNISITNKLIFNTSNSIIILHNKITNLENFLDINEENKNFILHCISENNKFRNFKNIILNTGKEYKNIYLLNIDKDNMNSNEFKNVIANFYKLIKQEDIVVLDVYLDIVIKEINKKDIISYFVESIILSNYIFDKYITKKIEKYHSINLIVDESINLESEKILEEYQKLAYSVIFARDLVNEPANFMNPSKFVDLVNKEAKDTKITVQVLEKVELEKLKMGAFLSVAKGSSTEPKFLIMRYLNNEKSNEVIGLVGKGITFDTGGLCLKTAKNMLDMKVDMAGAAAVIATTIAAAKTNLEVNLVTITALCENSLSAESSKPGDIIKSMAGKTIEIINTDAEGRLTLADAVYYAVSKEKVTKLIDVATLTGAAIEALGRFTTATISNNDNFHKLLEKASITSGEPIWRLPNNEKYEECLKSDIADLVNLNYDFGAGTIQGGIFIEQFVEKTPWIHMDIAGTCESKIDSGYLSKGATGNPVRTLYHLLKMESKKT